MSLSIRTSNKKDIPAIEEMMHEYEQVFDEYDFADFNAKIKPTIGDTSNESISLTLTQANTVAGFVNVSRVNESLYYIEVHVLVIAKAFSQQGYGKALLKEAINIALTKGFKYMILKTSNEDYNSPVHMFYERMGFNKIAVLPYFYTGDTKDEFEDCALFLRKIS